uniref:1D12A protein n=1 Tax=Homo sapiens TaxID=9606 RepID=Q07603_HUMAN|nr:1D12A [Homo sapiens]
MSQKTCFIETSRKLQTKKT